MTPRRLIPFAALLLACTALTGCIRKYTPPTFEIIGASVTERTDDGFVVTFSIRGENENDVPLPLKRVNYTVDLGDQRVFTGRRVAGATLPRYSTQIIELPAAVPDDVLAASALDQPLRFALKGHMTYVTPGLLAEILFDAGVRRPTIDFTNRGTLNPVEFEEGRVQPVDPPPADTENSD